MPKLAPAGLAGPAEGCRGPSAVQPERPSKGLPGQEPWQARGQREGRSGLSLVPAAPDRAPPLAEPTAQALREALGGGRGPAIGWVEFGTPVL